jgi:hypothetical protein
VRSDNCEKWLQYQLHRVCLSVRPSVSPRGTTRLQLGGFSSNLILEVSSKICRGSSKFIKIWQKWRVLYMKTYVHLWYTISRWIFLVMGNVSDKRWQENQNTHFMFNNFLFRKSWRLWDVEKYRTDREATDDNIMRRRKDVICVLDN